MRSIGFLVLAGALGGCAQPPPPSEVCTLIGCESGLTVVVEPAPSGDYAVRAETADSARTVQCTALQRCAEGAFFADFTPQRATVHVIAGGDTTVQSVTPSYETLQPNGPTCPPTCRRATVTVRRTGGDADR